MTGQAIPPTLVANAGDAGVAELLPRARRLAGLGPLLFREGHRGDGDAASPERSIALRAGVSDRHGPGRPRPSSVAYRGGSQGTARLRSYPRPWPVATARFAMVAGSAATTPMTDSGAAGGALALRSGSRAGSRWPAAPSPASAAGSRWRGISGASSSSTITATIRRRSRRRSTPSHCAIPGSRVWAVYEPLTSPPDGGDAPTLRRGPGPGRPRRHRRHLRRARSRHGHHRVGRRRGGRSPVRSRNVARSRRVRREATADALAPLVEFGDVVVLVMGGPRSSLIAERLVEALEAPEVSRRRGHAERGWRDLAVAR